MDTHFSVVFKGSIVEHMDMTEVERNLQQRFKFSQIKAKQFLSKPRIVKKDLTKPQALTLQGHLLKIGIHTQLVKTSCAAKPLVKPPATTAAEPLTSPQSISRDLIDQMLNGKMLPIKPTVSYNVGLFFTLLLVLLLPIVYLSITFSTINATFWFASNVSSIVDFQQFKIFKLVVVISVIFMGILLSFFLLRPLVPMGHKNTDALLDEKSHPDLFYLIQRLSDYMSVPMPAEIRVDHEVNASASLKDGMRSLINKKLILTLGYPLISGMNTRQLVGVIAHEFGHFSQRYGMTVYYLINIINYWLKERAYANYGLALTLKTWRNKYESDYILIPIWTASAGIFISQQFLKYLSHLSLYFSQYMTRQMEFNADHHECRVVGSDYFSDTSMRLHQLSFAQDKVAAINATFWNENVLLNNIPKAINTLANQLTNHEKEQVQESIDFQQTHPWDSHPADNQRIDHAIELREKGVFTMSVDASCLFDDYDHVCQQQTLNIYNGERKNKFDEQVVDNEVLFNMHQDDVLSIKLSRMALFGIELGNRLANIPVTLPDNLKEVSLEEINAHFLDAQNQIKKNVLNYDTARSKRFSHNKAYAYVESGFDIDCEAFNLSEGEERRVKSVVDKTEASFAEAEAAFKHFDQLVTARLIAQLKGKSEATTALAYAEIKALKSIKGLEIHIEKAQVVMACINMLIDDEDLSEAKDYVITSYQKELAKITSDLWQSIALIQGVNRFSKTPLTLLEFSETWQKKPIIALEKLAPEKLTSYSSVLCNSIMKQHQLHFRKLLMIIHNF